jgi:hypothetical protein
MAARTSGERSAWTRASKLATQTGRYAANVSITRVQVASNRSIGLAAGSCSAARTCSRAFPHSPIASLIAVVSSASFEPKW